MLHNKNFLSYTFSCVYAKTYSYIRKVSLSLCGAAGATKGHRSRLSKQRFESHTRNDQAAAFSCKLNFITNRTVGTYYPRKLKTRAPSTRLKLGWESGPGKIKNKRRSKETIFFSLILLFFRVYHFILFILFIFYVFQKLLVIISAGICY